MSQSFIGIDLAWQSERNPSGAAVLRGDHHGIELHEVAPPLHSLEAVKAWLSSRIGDNTIIAVDAPLVIENDTGLRQCEREVSTRYGVRHASCHASNRSLYPDAASVRLASWLRERGFVDAPSGFSGRVLLEVYPHAAFVALFDLPTIIKYKKGRVAEKCSGLVEVQNTLRKLATADAPLRSSSELEALLSQDPSRLKGRARKNYEDSLDAVFCAYLAFYAWRFGEASSEIFGTQEAGYIVNPRLRPTRSSVAAA